MNKELMQTITVLLVEDEDELREEVATTLSYFLQEIICAKDGVDGLEKYHQNKHRIDIIITDINMPRKNGIEMIEMILAEDDSIPVIYATAFSDVEYLLKTIQQNISGYILKPIDIEKLLAAIDKAALRIENKRLKEELLRNNKSLELELEKKAQELAKQNQQLIHQLYTDELTSLPNRKQLLEDIAQQDQFILLLVDIDSFKTINDIYSEAVGNEVLQQFAKVLESIALNSMKVYRVGSDQFVFVKEVQYEMNELKQFIQEVIQKILMSTITLPTYDLSLRLNVTVGVTTAKENSLEFADMALKKAKSQKKHFIIFEEDKSIYTEYKEFLQWNKMLQYAIEQNSVIAFFQPIYDKALKIVKYESLMRLEIDGTLYVPDDFLYVAKKTKFYHVLQEQMLQKLFVYIENTKKHITINVSIEDIVNEKFVSIIKEKFSTSNIASFITFELLESESIYDFKRVQEFIKTIKSYGAFVAIDDFGSGYSNFAYLLQLEPDYIKIDGTLIQNIDHDKNSFIIVNTICQFAHQLNIKVVAEYVHSKEVLEKLQLLEIDYYQGYYLGKPMR